MKYDLIQIIIGIIIVGMSIYIQFFGLILSYQSVAPDGRVTITNIYPAATYSWAVIFNILIALLGLTLVIIGIWKLVKIKK